MDTRRALRALLLGATGLIVSAGTVPLTGCSNFFVCQKASCPSSGGGSGSTGTGDYVYVSNSSSGNTSINAYQVGTGTLTAVTNSPYNLTYIPVGMVVSPNDASLYVISAAGGTNSGLYSYPITTTTGALSTGSELVQGNFAALAVSADGNFLFTLDADTGTILTEYSLNTSTGAVTGTTVFAAPGGPVGLGCPVSSATPASATCSIAVSPSENFVSVSVGTNGTVIYPYTSSQGITSAYTGIINSPSATSGDYSAAFDKSGYLYIGRSLELSPYTSLSATTPTAGSSMTFASGAVPRSVTLSTGYNYVYTADEGASQISAFSISTGTLAQLTGSPIGAPTNVSALAAERSGTYLLAAGYGSGGLQMYPISTTGLSTSVASEPTGTDTTIPIVMAVSH